MGICFNCRTKNINNKDVILNETTSSQKINKTLMPQKGKNFIKLKTRKIQNLNENPIPSFTSTELFLRAKSFSHFPDNLNSSFGITFNTNKKTNKKLEIEKTTTIKTISDKKSEMKENKNREKENYDSQNMEYEIEKENEKNNFPIDDNKYIINILKEHFLFFDFDENTLNFLIDDSTGIQLEKNMIIFKEGEEANSFYILRKGEIEIFDQFNSKIINKKYSTFGEIGLININAKRKYTAKTNSIAQLYVIDKNLYLSYKKENNNIEENNEDKMNIFEKQIIFKFISYIEKISFINLSLIQTYNKNSNIEIKDSFNIIDNNIMTFKRIYVIKGKIQFSFSQDNSSNTISEYINNGNIFDLNSAIFSTYNQILISSLSKRKIKENSIKVISCLNDTKVFIYNDKSLIECFGIGPISYLLNICLNYFISQDLIFSKIIKNCQIPNEMIRDLFQIKRYKKNELIVSKGLSNNNKCFLILNGKISNKKQNSYEISQGQFFKGELMFIFQELEIDIYAINDSIICETTKDYLISTLKQKNLNTTFIISLFNILNKFQIFSQISIQNAFEIVNNLNIKIYNEKEIILNQNQEVNKFYLIEKGIVQASNSEKNIKIFEKGNSFGKFFILNEQKSIYIFK